VIPECLYLSFTVLRGDYRVFIGGYRECLEVVIECLVVIPECLYLSFTVLRGGDRVFRGGYRVFRGDCRVCVPVIHSVKRWLYSVYRRL